MIHCGSGPAPGKYTGPERVERVLARHPRLRLVVAHMGMPEYAGLGLGGAWLRGVCPDNGARLFGLE